MLQGLTTAGPSRFLGAALDLTERKHTEQALRQSQTELQLIINAMPVLIGYVDHEERFRLNNSAYLDWYGMTPQELYGKSIREVLGDEAYAGRERPDRRRTQAARRAAS